MKTAPSVGENRPNFIETCFYFQAIKQISLIPKRINALIFKVGSRSLHLATQLLLVQPIGAVTNLGLFLCSAAEPLHNSQWVLTILVLTALHWWQLLAMIKSRHSSADSLASKNKKNSLHFPKDFGYYVTDTAVPDPLLGEHSRSQGTTLTSISQECALVFIKISSSQILEVFYI